MSPEEIRKGLEALGYIADETLATALHLTVRLGRPLLLEGEAGVGKTELAKALAELLKAKLIRLQCYEGLDASHVLYEWNYQRQLLAIRARDDKPAAEIEQEIFSEPFLLRRPLLQAISEDQAPVLLVDEIDRADEAFEAYLLELFSDFQVTIPEFGTIRAKARPHVILTSNGTRALSDALRRRCLYSYVAFPAPEQEAAIIQARLPGVERSLAEAIARFVSSLRREDLEKKPGIAEALDWTAALMGMDVSALEDDPKQVHAALVCLLKTEADQAAVTREVVDRLLGEAA